MSLQISICPFISRPSWSFSLYVCKHYLLPDDGQATVWVSSSSLPPPLPDGVWYKRSSIRGWQSECPHTQSTIPSGCCPKAVLLLQGKIRKLMWSRCVTKTHWWWWEPNVNIDFNLLLLCHAYHLGLLLFPLSLSEQDCVQRGKKEYGPCRLRQCQTPMTYPVMTGNIRRYFVYLLWIYLAISLCYSLPHFLTDLSTATLSNALLNSFPKVNSVPLKHASYLFRKSTLFLDTVQKLVPKGKARLQF